MVMYLHSLPCFSNRDFRVKILAFAVVETTVQSYEIRKHSLRRRQDIIGLVALTASLHMHPFQLCYHRAQRTCTQMANATTQQHIL